MTKHSFIQNPDMALNLVNLERFPIENLESGKGAAFLKECQDHMKEHGWFNFDGFIKPDALEALAQESNDLLPTAETLTIKRTIYQGKVDPSAPENDPRRQEYRLFSALLSDSRISNRT